MTAPPAQSEPPAPPAPRVGIVLLNWNAWRDTVACVQALRQLRYPHRRIVVVDNSSRDDSLARIAAACPDVVLLPTGGNLGATGGQAVGVQYVVDHGFDFFLTFNNDAVPDPDALSALIGAAQERPDAAIFGAKIYHQDRPDTLWYAGGGWIPEQCCTFLEGAGRRDDGRSWEATRETAWVCGCCLLARCEVVRRIGIQEPRFFIYEAEIDWCFRARRAGFKCLLVPPAKVYHRVAGTADHLGTHKYVEYFQWRNHLLLIERHAPRARWLKFLLWSILRETPRLIWQALRPGGTPAQRTRARMRLLGERDYLLRRFANGPPRIYQR